MCGYACCGCGRCTGSEPKFRVGIESVRGWCSSCETLNAPSAKVCKGCGAVLASLREDVGADETKIRKDG